MYTLYIWNIILIENLDGEMLSVLVASGSTVPTAQSNQILSATQLSLVYKLDTASLTRHQAGVLLQLLTDKGPPRSSLSNCSAVSVPSIASQFLLKTEYALGSEGFLLLPRRE